jgi:hypothetical protein
MEGARGADASDRRRGLKVDRRLKYRRLRAAKLRNLP